MLESVHIPEAARRLRQYPHELSGGMRQRVMIAMALIAEPEVLLADEPSTALDVTVQAQILSLLQELRARTGTAIVLVTHDLGVIAEVADRVAVMYAGRIIEQAPVHELFAHPRHPYTEALQQSIPRIDAPRPTHLASIGGAPPNPAALPAGCAFAPRCIYRLPICEAIAPALLETGSAHWKACHHQGALGQTARRGGMTPAGPARPAVPAAQPALVEASVLLTVRGLSVTYRVAYHGGHALLRAVNGVSFELARGETLGLVGESGSGKSSIARALLRLVPASGTVMFHGIDLLGLSGARLHAMRRHLQLIFQDPLASLDPRMSIGNILGEPLRVFEPQLSGEQRLQRVLAMARAVGLGAEHLHRYPHEFSGGQAQRIGIARALIVEPELIVCDEPLSALDVSIKSQISNLLKDLQRQLQLSLLFISHDLAAVRFSCNRVLVLYLGRVMEMAGCDALFNASRHPYTRALMRAAPIPDPVAARARRSAPLEGEIPSPLFAPSGCVFRTRCPMAIERCTRELPVLRPVGASQVACHRAEEVGD